MILRIRHKLEQSETDELPLSDSTKDQLRLRMDDIICTLPDDLKAVLKTSWWHLLSTGQPTNLAVTVESVVNLDITTTVGLCFSHKSNFSSVQCDVVNIGHKAIMIRTEEICTFSKLKVLLTTLLHRCAFSPENWLHSYISEEITCYLFQVQWQV